MEWRREIELESGHLGCWGVKLMCPVILNHNSVCERVASIENGTTNRIPVNFFEHRCKGPLHNLSSAISNDGTLVGLSNIDQMWLYRIHYCKAGPKVEY